MQLTTTPCAGKRERGFTLLEALVSLVILVFGVLGLIGLQAHSQIATFESYQRGQAMILVQDMADRIATNRAAAGCYVTSGLSPQFRGIGGPVPGPCTALVGTATTRALAADDFAAWDAALKGASETKGGTNVGAVLGARGCVTYTPATNSYRVAVAWQGMAPTVAPDSGDADAICAKGQYSTNDANRREVSITVRIASLI